MVSAGMMFTSQMGVWRDARSGRLKFKAAFAAAGAAVFLVVNGSAAQFDGAGDGFGFGHDELPH